MNGRMQKPSHASATQGTGVTNLIRLESFRTQLTGEPAKVKILVVDDEKGLLDLLRATIETMGHELMDIASNGYEAIEKAIRGRPDLILMDINIPDLSGVEAAKVILAEHACPLIFMSGLSVDETLARVSQVKAQGYLVKPFIAEQLRSAIEFALRDFQQASSASNEIAMLRDELDSQKVLDEAIGRMRRIYGHSREKSLEQLQAMAKTRRCTLIEAAQQTCQLLAQREESIRQSQDS